MPKNIKVRKRKRTKLDSTDINLLVAPESSDEFFEWDKSKIANALKLEAGIDDKLSAEIADAVEQRVLALKIQVVSTSLIRELVDNELFSRGCYVEWEKQKVIGLPKYDIDELICHKSKDNSNVHNNNPEAIGHTLAETIMKQYALQEVFSKDVSDSHRSGLIYIHDLGMPTRIYCSGHSVEYIKKYGVKLENLQSVSGPAKHARTLSVHVNTFLSVMQAYYAGALGLSYVNIAYAPYLEGMSDKEIYQEAQHLMYQTSQNAFSRGGQTLFVDFNVHTHVPKHMKNIRAIGPGGQYLDRDYQSYEELAAKFAKCLIQIAADGDYYHRIMPFPKIDLHIDADTFKNDLAMSVLDEACKAASKNGSIYFIFDRDSVTMSACCRLRTSISDTIMIEKPETMRFAGFQNVTINLPQCAYRANGNVSKFFKELDKAIELCVKAHLDKRKFIRPLMLSPAMPLWQIGKPAEDGRPYVDLDEATYIVGVIGLNECLQSLYGRELHDGEEMVWNGLKIISHMYFAIKKHGKKHNLKFTLEESPAESASRRLAKIDLRNFKNAIVRGDVNNDSVYYTNSIHIRADANVDFLTRIQIQSKFHSLIESGAIIHAFVGENLPSAGSIKALLRRVLDKTDAAQITISPEFTTCNNCRNSFAGIKDKCIYCGVSNIDVKYLLSVDGDMLPWNYDVLASVAGG